MRKTSSAITRRKFTKIAAAGLVNASVLDGVAFAAAGEKEGGDIGPVLGHIDQHRIFCFIRHPKAGVVTLMVKDGKGKKVARLESEAKPENDFCVRFEVVDLAANSEYVGEFFDAAAAPLFESAGFHTRTPAAPDDETNVVLGLGSCVSSTKFDEIWRQIAAQKVDGFCLLGDTPYIDSNVLDKNRAARRTFWSALPGLVELEKTIPFWNTWDDHDFGKNDSDGLMPKKEDIRKAFLEYNALANYGEDDQGIYTRFRRGPVEVWFIDDRWFSQTGPSWANPDQKTCLGLKQWEWLQRTLKASTAPFKLLCTGMVWYPKGNKEKDHWETYSAEREAIFAYIRKEKVPGVVLISGDIHVSRHHDYGSERLGYPLHECVVSPMHERIIPALDVAHPARIWSRPEPNVFLKVDADTTSLVARWINMAGEEIHVLNLTAADLTAPTGG